MTKFSKLIPVALLIIQRWGLIYFISITSGWNSVRNTESIYNTHSRSFLKKKPLSVKLKDRVSLCPVYRLKIPQYQNRYRTEAVLIYH